MSKLKVNKIENTATSDGGVSIDASGHVELDGIQFPSAGQLSDRGLIINGAMLVAQRGTSSTDSGYNTVDRFAPFHDNVVASPTWAQVDVSSGTDPYLLGFRKALKVTNGATNISAQGGQTTISHRIEAQNIANSGWNYTSPTSYITLAFWVKSSVGQDFKGFLKTEDGTEKSYPFATGMLTAGVWTKITKTIPGHADLQFDNDASAGLEITISAFQGFDYTDGTVVEDAWMNWTSTARTFTQNSAWFFQNGATFEVTGFQLEVGKKLAPFQHRSYGDELARCQRYYILYSDTPSRGICTATLYHNNIAFGVVSLPVTMRDNPTSASTSGSNHFDIFSAGTNTSFNALTIQETSKNSVTLESSSTLSLVQGNSGWIRTNLGKLAFQAEL